MWESDDGWRPRRDLKEMLNTPNMTKKAARFVIATGPLGPMGAITEKEIQ
jgi:hypothetical protein